MIKKIICEDATSLVEYCSAKANRLYNTRNFHLTIYSLPLGSIFKNPNQNTACGCVIAGKCGL